MPTSKEARGVAVTWLDVVIAHLVRYRALRRRDAMLGIRKRAACAKTHQRTVDVAAVAPITRIIMAVSVTVWSSVQRRGLFPWSISLLYVDEISNDRVLFHRSR